MKKFNFLSLIIISTSAFSNEDTDLKIKELQIQIDEIRMVADNQRIGAKTADGRPKIVDSKGIMIGVGAVYQSIHLAGTDYAYTDDGIAAFLPFTGQVYEPKSAWAWGIDAILGYDFSRDGWDARLTNAYFKATQSDAVLAGWGGNVIPARVVYEVVSFIAPNDFWICAEAHSNISLAYDLIGLELGRDYFVSRHLSLRPLLGLLGSWMWNTQNIVYSGDPKDIVTPVLGNDSYKTQDRLDWYGIGPQVGLETKWGLGKGISFFADAKAALMVGKYRVVHQEEFTRQPNSAFPGPYLIEMRSTYRRILPYLQTLIGLSYDFFSDDQTNQFLIRLGYNVQLFAGANEFIMPDQINESDSAPGPRPELFALPTFRSYFNNMMTSGLLIDTSWTF